MTEKEAILESIAAWEKKAEATDPHDVEMGPEACPLCLWATDDVELRYPHCLICPVFRVTGTTGCGHTPYDDALDAFEDWEHSRTDYNRKRFHAAARAEVAFLKGLLK